MTDSTHDRRHRGRRGSLLDHARDAQPDALVAPGEPPVGPQREDVPSPTSVPSMLSAPVRSARVSTARFAGASNPASRQQAEPLLAAAPPSADARSLRQPDRSAPAARERFGDRISRLIGTIAPEAIAPEERPGERNQANDGSGDAGPDTLQRKPRRQYSSRQPVERAPQLHDQPGFDRQPHDEHRPRDGRDHWHSASGGHYGDDNRPLLDASILISAVWRFRRLIGAATVAGAVIGVLLALSTPHRFYAESRLFVDPREIRVTDDDIRNQQLSTEAMLAITDSQLQILSSTGVLEKVVQDLNLDRDPEFNGSMAACGISGGLSLIKQIFTGKDATSEGEQKALNNLRKALHVFRDAKTFVIIVGVDTRDAEKSALIANQIVETYLDSEGQAQSNLLERTSESIDTRINSLRADLDQAEREVERFKAENGLVGVGGQFIDDKEILALSDQLGNARAMKVGIRVKADNLAKVKIDDVLSGAFPEELLSSNLSELRKQYTQTKSNAEALATRLGPRHPQYIAAKQSLDTITNEISAELRRIVASSQTELQRAVETEQELASQMAVAKSRAMDQSVELVTLRELERKATATRGIYEAFLTRSRETSERSNLSTRNVRVISPAEAPILPMGPSRKFIAIGGMMAGFFAGLGLALLVGAIESIRAYNGDHYNGRYRGGPSGGYPQPPEPGPRTPPGGPGSRARSRYGDEAAGHHSTMPETAAYPVAGARAQSAEAETQSSTAGAGPVADDTVTANAVPPGSARTGFFRPGWARARPSDPEPRTPKNVKAASAAPGAVATQSKSAQPQDRDRLQAAAEVAVCRNDGTGHHAAFRHQAAASSVTFAPQLARNDSAPGRDDPEIATSPAQPDVEQPGWQPYPAVPSFQPQPAYRPQQYAELEQHAQPMYPVQPFYHPAHQHQLLSQNLHHPGSAAVPHAPVPQAPNWGHSGAYAGPYQAAPVYPAVQQQMPISPHLYPPQTYPPQAYPVVHSAIPTQWQAHPASAQPQQPVYQDQSQSVRAAAPGPAAAPLRTPPAESAAATSRAVDTAPPARPADQRAIDRIRREMDELRSRIDDYSTVRRSA